METKKTNKNDTVKAVGIQRKGTDFVVKYENGKEKYFDLEYMNRIEADFEEDEETVEVDFCGVKIKLSPQEIEDLWRQEIQRKQMEEQKCKK